MKLEKIYVKVRKILPQRTDFCSAMDAALNCYCMKKSA